MRLRPAAFTLLELVIVIVIIAILVALSVPVISTLRARAQRSQCTANLRSLHIAADLYLQDKGSWPQIRLSGNDDSAQQDYARQWIDVLRSFGPTEKTWICPTLENLLGNPDYLNPQNIRSDYFAMPFDDKPGTPHQWPRQPWFVEVGDVHGNGNLIVFADGSVRDLKTVAASAGAK
ncbi:MAG TPA: prepilin-type N-terminal cleavage/methylation domain-containing protein [Chthoniobacterales bacterium]|jgi:prepilin-type N-terminal cleavage/methylation domain-containing protein